MQSRFLPEFPQPGLTLDYITEINNLFTSASQHMHEPNKANIIQSDSIRWLSMNLSGEIVNLSSVTFNDTKGSTHPTYSVYFIGNDLYYESSTGSVQITRNGLVNASVSFAGVRGDLTTNKVDLFYSNEDSSWNFTSELGAIGIICDTATITNVICENITTTSLHLVKAPPSSTIGYCYINDDGIFQYSDFKFIRIDKTTPADMLIFDNKITFNNPPVGYTFPTRGSLTESGIITTYVNNNIIETQTKYAYLGQWFPALSHGTKQQFFYQLLAKSGISENADEIFLWKATGGIPSIVSPNVRVVISNLLNGPMELNHHQIHPVWGSDSPYDTFNNITSFMDCSFQHNEQKFVIFDMKTQNLTSNVNYKLYFHFSALYDFGTVVV